MQIFESANKNVTFIKKNHTLSSIFFDIPNFSHTYDSNVALGASSAKERCSRHLMVQNTQIAINAVYGRCLSAVIWCGVVEYWGLECRALARHQRRSAAVANRRCG